jgi:hypothetical protein
MFLQRGLQVLIFMSMPVVEIFFAFSVRETGVGNRFLGLGP